MIHLRRNVCFVIFTLVLMLTVSCGQSNVELFEYLPETSVVPQYSETEEDSPDSGVHAPKTNDNVSINAKRKTKTRFGIIHLK